MMQMPTFMYSGGAMPCSNHDVQLWPAPGQVVFMS